MGSVKMSKPPDFKKTTDRLTHMSEAQLQKVLHTYGARGVSALSSATPFDTGGTARAWKYTLVSSKGRHKLSFSNSVMIDGVPLVILLIYGHGTRQGGYVAARNFMTPALMPVFESLKTALIEEALS